MNQSHLEILSTFKGYYEYINHNDLIDGYVFVNENIAYIGLINIIDNRIDKTDMVVFFQKCKQVALLKKCNHIIGPVDGPALGFNSGCIINYDSKTLPDLDIITLYKDRNIPNGFLDCDFDTFGDTRHMYEQDLTKMISYYTANIKDGFESELKKRNVKIEKISSMNEQEFTKVSYFWDRVISPEMCKKTFDLFLKTTNCVNYSFKVTYNDEIIGYCICYEKNGHFIGKHLAFDKDHVKLVEHLPTYSLYKFIHDQKFDTMFDKFFWVNAKFNFSEKQMERFYMKRISNVLMFNSKL